MTNEELVMIIQRGHREYYAELWEQVQKLISSLIRREACSRILPQDIDIEDLLQCGCFAMIAAVKAFRPEKELKFNSYLGFHVKNEVNTALCHGVRNKKHVQEYSYNLPAGNEDKETELLDLIPDESIEGQYEQIELTELQITVRQAISELPTFQQNIINLNISQELSLPKIAAALNISLDVIRKEKCNAIKELRKNRTLLML